jgi:ligand-binding sensor domain-containing protein
MKFLLNLLLLVSLLFSLELKAQSVSNTFLQEIKTDVVLPPEAGKTIIKLFKVNDKVVVVTSNGVFRYADGKWSGQSVVNQWITATLDEMGNVWLASTHTIQQENKKSLSLPSMAKNDTILCLYWENDKTLHVGTTKGLWTLTDIWRKNPDIHSYVNAITFDAQNQCWVATNEGLWRRKDGHWVNMDETMMDRANGRTYIALEQQITGRLCLEI